MGNSKMYLFIYFTWQAPCWDLTVSSFVGGQCAAVRTVGESRVKGQRLATAQG